MKTMRFCKPRSAASSFNAVSSGPPPMITPTASGISETLRTNASIPVPPSSGPGKAELHDRDAQQERGAEDDLCPINSAGKEGSCGQSQNAGFDIG